MRFAVPGCSRLVAALAVAVALVAVPAVAADGGTPDGAVLCGPGFTQQSLLWPGGATYHQISWKLHSATVLNPAFGYNNDYRFYTTQASPTGQLYMTSVPVVYGDPTPGPGVGNGWIRVDFQAVASVVGPPIPSPYVAGLQYAFWVEEDTDGTPGFDCSTDTCGWLDQTATPRPLILSSGYKGTIVQASHTFRRRCPGVDGEAAVPVQVKVYLFPFDDHPTAGGFPVVVTSGNLRVWVGNSDGTGGPL